LGEKEVPYINAIWLQGQGCSGCTVSFLNASHPSLIDIMTGFMPQSSGVELPFHQTIAFSWGSDVVRVLEAADEGRFDPFVLILEGAIPDEEAARKSGGFWCAVSAEDGEMKSVSDWVTMLSRRAAAAVAAGTCASYGGIPHGKPNPTGAKGLLDFLTPSWKSTLGLPVVCIPGCPAHGEHLAEAATHLVLAVRGYLPFPELDEHHRPKYIFGSTVHDRCPRAGYFGSGKYNKEFGEPYCVGMLGCKGLIAHCDTPVRGYVEGVGGCTRLGSPCIGCTEPVFPDAPMSPFLRKAPASAYAKDTLSGITGSLWALFKRLERRGI